GGRRNPVRSVSVHQARLQNILFTLAETSGGHQQHDYETHNCSLLWFSSCCCCIVTPRAVIFALRLWYIIGTSVSIEARLCPVRSQVDMSAVARLTLPDARAKRPAAIKGVI